MSVYLLDTCIWSIWFDPKKNGHAKVIEKVNGLQEKDRLGISIITWGEIAYGHFANPKEPTNKQTQYLEFIKSKGPITFDIDIHTANTYGEIRARLFEKFTDKEKKSGLRPEQLIDPITSKELGIQENDLWIVAQALTRNLTFITKDL